MNFKELPPEELVSQEDAPFPSALIELQKNPLLPPISTSLNESATGALIKAGSAAIDDARKSSRAIINKLNF